MSMSTHVVGFRPPDEKWQKMKEVWDVCQKNGIDIPEEVGDFFDWENPDERGIEIELEKEVCCIKWCKDSSEGFEIDLARLPPQVTHIRFYNSW